MKNKSLIRILSVGVTPSLLLGSSAWAQSYESVVDTKVSVASVDAAIVLDTAGTLIGDHDSESNPGGTQTRSGIFGGSGNEAIGTSISMAADTLLDTNPSGGFVITPDFDLNLVEIEGLTIDLLNGQSGGTDLSVTMLYDTFHTVSPSFIYPGGVPITLPIGEIGGITVARLTQSDLGAGTLSPTDDPDVYDMTILVSALLDMEINTSLPGQDPTSTPIEALPIVLPISGQITIVENGILLINVDIAPDPIVIDIPIEGATLPPIPFELPTFGSDTASVIFTSIPQSISVNATLSLTLSADGVADLCPADLNNDGTLNFFDVSAFLNAFSAGCP